MNKYSGWTYRAAAIVFVVSLLALLTVSPGTLGLTSLPQWMFLTRLGLGAICVLTIPMAWRWLYLRK